MAPPPDADAAPAAEPSADELAKQLALVGKRPVHLGADDISDSDSEPDSEEEERLRPPGPPDPEKCVVNVNRQLMKFHNFHDVSLQVVLRKGGNVQTTDLPDLPFRSPGPVCPAARRALPCRSS